ncbi:Oligosaccharyl transferase STT3 subunit [Persephonella hydrogeniphila]|uniref:Oligosaccharyl transferase STT3 subunit n=1 Tax=Persephonella hydrogeniphila TaxID=198703 RepID=A0A285NPW6_9AQUI|nr:STT3 domain-containing protein [Persephonella hydrogeniphila]SNZ11552.1 Oligosaccharyl transferase STT3 subunit [Persephonella hydrogeniphila]
MKKNYILIGEIFLFLVIGGINLFFKLRSLKYFSSEDNVLSCYDCLFYARLAKDYFENKLTAIDYLTNVPDFAVLSPIPMFIVYLPTWIFALTGISLSDIFLFLPPILSVLFIVPMYYWLKSFAPIHVFIGAAFLGIFNSIYYIRTSLGRYDTDFLILFFVFLILFFITKAVFDKRKSYFYILLSGLIFNLFMFWYFKPVLVIFFALSLLLGLLIHKEPLKEIFKKVSVFSIAAGILYFIPLLSQVKHYFLSYILKESPNFLPVGTQQFIIELQPVNLHKFVNLTTDNIGTVLFAVIGLIFLFIKYYRYMIVTLPIIFLGLTVFTAGERFLIYLSPFLGMGVGYVIYILQNIMVKKISSELIKKFVISAMIVITAFISMNSNILIQVSPPIVQDDLVQAYKELDKKIDKDAYIWAWWDYGNEIEYFLKRGTYIDNHSFNQIKTYFFAHSMLIHNEEKSRNIIAFITNNHFKDYGLNIETREDLFSLKNKAYTYKEKLRNPVYVYWNPRDIYKDVILQLGIYGTKEYIGDINLAKAFFECIEEEKVYNCGRFDFDKTFLIVYWKNEKYKEELPYREVNYVEIKENEKNIYVNLVKNENAQKRLMLEFIRYKDKLYFLIADIKFKDSIFHRLMIFDKSLKYFEPVYIKFPDLVVYEVM